MRRVPRSVRGSHIAPVIAIAIADRGGLFHAGSVGIIMSGWLGAMNYGVIVSNDVDKYLTPAAATV